VFVEIAVEALLEDREHIVDKRRSPGHPLKIRSASVGIGAIETRMREAVDEPAEERLVADVHPQRDVGLPSISSERPLADQHTDQHALLKVAKRPGRSVGGHPSQRAPASALFPRAAVTSPVLTACCFTVKKNVKRGTCGRAA
jgi:hypothetical protein